jgi:hypothetical protein
MSEKLVTVARFTEYPEADLARQLLEDAGIKAFVMNQNVQVAWGIYPPGGIELQAAESEAQEAREILKAQEAESEEPGDDEDFDGDEPDLDDGEPDEEQE